MSKEKDAWLLTATPREILRAMLPPVERSTRYVAKGFKAKFSGANRWWRRALTKAKEKQGE